jgi:hypothetical protein
MFIVICCIGRAGNIELHPQRAESAIQSPRRALSPPRRTFAIEIARQYFPERRPLAEIFANEKAIIYSLLHTGIGDRYIERLETKAERCVAAFHKYFSFVTEHDKTKFIYRR